MAGADFCVGLFNTKVINASYLTDSFHVRITKRFTNIN